MSRTKLLLAAAALTVTFGAQLAYVQTASAQTANAQTNERSGARLGLEPGASGERTMPQLGGLQDETLEEIAQLQATIQKLQLQLQAAKLQEQIDRIHGAAEDDAESQNDAAEADDGTDDGEAAPEPEPQPAPAPMPGPGAGANGGGAMFGAPAAAPQAPLPSVKTISGAGGKYRARLELPRGGSIVVAEGSEAGDGWTVSEITRTSVQVKDRSGTTEMLDMKRAGSGGSGEQGSPSIPEEPAAAVDPYSREYPGEEFDDGAFSWQETAGPETAGPETAGPETGAPEEPDFGPEDGYEGSDEAPIYDEPIVLDGFSRD